ncbi:SRPBCC family protein [uncultured Ferrimonas sp.]|uniref:SRPBCC family protein n=1 Tax=uncultured Ferrimonas sp. TaxID=432640 RepID=UPI00260CCC2F|nr:SRPBCC family protein [uncultured Ferrimonas sp.]
MSTLVDLQLPLAAPPQQVMATLLAHTQLSRFFSAQFELVREAKVGQPRGGVGAVRQVTTMGNTFNEEVLHADDALLSYCIVGEGPLVDHLGEIRLTPTATGCQLHYRIKGRSATWVPTWLVALVLRRQIAAAMHKLQEHFHAD